MRKFISTLPLAVSGLAFTALAVSVLLVFQATRADIKEDARGDLEASQHIISKLLQDNENRLTAQAAALTQKLSEFNSLPDNGSISSHILQSLWLQNALLQNNDVDLFLLISRQGKIVAANRELNGATAILENAATARRDSFSTLVVVDNHLYQVVLTPAAASSPVAWAGQGIAIDTPVARLFKQISAADILFLVQNSTTAPLKIIADPTVKLAQRIAEGEATLESAPRQFAGDHWVSAQVTLLHEGERRIDALAIKSLAPDYRRLHPLYSKLLLVAAIAILAAVLLGILISRTITRPIDALAKAAMQFAAGNYQHDIKLHPRNEFATLVRALQNMRAAIFERETRIRHQAQYDLLTNLPNKSFMSEVIQNRLTEGGHPTFALGLIRMKNLSELTDSYGIDWGDRLVRQVAERLSGTLRRGDIIARQSTSQFLVFCDDVNLQGIELVAAKIADAIAIPFNCDPIEVLVEINIGFVLTPAHGDSRDDLLRRAHIALSHAQSANLSHAIYQIGQDEQHLRQIKLTHKLQQAIEDNSLELHYQPKFDLHRDRVTGVEALLRWHDPEMGQVFPDEFIPIAEKSGFIQELTDWVLDNALRQAQAWREQGMDLTVSVNISAHDLLQDTFVDSIIGKIKSHAIEPSQLSLEITESAMVAEPERAISYLQQIKEQGVGLAIDDFGTGFSSLWQLKSIPVNELKIDKTFIMNLADSPDDQKIVKSTIELGHNLGLLVTAEGVENYAAVRLLQAMGCDAIQGFLLSRPIPAHEFNNWLVKQPSLRETTAP